MAKGRVAGVGRHEALLESCSEYAALVRRQLTAQQDDLDAALPPPPSDVDVDAAADVGPSPPTAAGSAEPAQAGRSPLPIVAMESRPPTDSDSDGY